MQVVIMIMVVGINRGGLPKNIYKRWVLSYLFRMTLAADMSIQTNDLVGS
jgi:hypothetical protein|tara:strand:+ start:557 stop:706 length:150 start_codon:yes stop_codon:yes gene_type:complete